jgi:hypothetical protein
MVVVGVEMTAVASVRADSAGLPCALTTPASAATASSGHPCWVDYDAYSPSQTGISYMYPFGADGNPVSPTSSGCSGSLPGPAWQGDFTPTTGQSACYLQVNSFAFRAWNRGLAATGPPRENPGTGATPFGVWLFNGTDWYPDPTFPGSSTCPGNTVLWAGKLDYWLVGGRTLCRFDGIDLVWEPLSLPQATIARLQNAGQATGGIRSGACYTWDNCWFFGDAGTVVHWDGQVLSDATPGAGASPWLEGEFRGAVAARSPSGQEFGLAVTDGIPGANGGPPPTAPDGSAAPQIYTSQGGPFAPLAGSSPAALLQASGLASTDLVALTTDPQGDVWAAGQPTPGGGGTDAPLLRLSSSGSASTCSGYGATTFSYNPLSGITQSFAWQATSVFPADGSVLAGAHYQQQAATFPDPPEPGVTITDDEPVLVHGVCGAPPTVTRFRIPNPRMDQTTSPALMPADEHGWTTAVVANADNDAWAATTDGTFELTPNGGQTASYSMKPHLYRWTDGQPPDAPAGDDNESRPSLFTLSPPVYQIGAPTIVTVPGPITVTPKPGKPKKVKLPSPIYSIHSKVRPAARGAYTLYLTFKVRRPVTLGLEALRGHAVVASTGLKHFAGRTGELKLTLHRKHWPTRLRLITPHKGSSSASVPGG